MTENKQTNQDNINKDMCHISETNVKLMQHNTESQAKAYEPYIGTNIILKDSLDEYIRPKLMEVEHVDNLVPWNSALNAARRTVGKERKENEPSDAWKSKMLLAEHSPIRLVQYGWTWKQMPQWVTVHYVRHHIGCEKFVHTQRTDRTGSDIPRNEHLQGELNDMDMVANAQEIINISKVRLCSKASKETRHAWKLFLEKLNEKDPVLVSKCVPTCVYRGFCPELKCCGYVFTDKYKKQLEEYRKDSDQYKQMKSKENN